MKVAAKQAESLPGPFSDGVAIDIATTFEAWHSAVNVTECSPW